MNWKQELPTAVLIVVFGCMCYMLGWSNGATVARKRAWSDCAPAPRENVLLYVGGAWKTE